MALQLNIQDTSFGITAPTAYAKITNFNYDMQSGSVQVGVAFYLSAAARRANKTPINHKSFSGMMGYAPGQVDLDTELPVGFRTTIYTWLKTLPDFVGATDVIDAAPADPTIIAVTLNVGSSPPYPYPGPGYGMQAPPPSPGGSIQLSAIAPRGGATVALSSSSESLTVPATVDVVQGTMWATFAVTVAAVTEAEGVTITATLGESTHTAATTLVPPVTP